MVSTPRSVRAQDDMVLTAPPVGHRAVPRRAALSLVLRVSRNPCQAGPDPERSEGSPMATSRTTNRQTFLYLGLAGETGRGRTVESGLYRMADGHDEWQLIAN